MRSWPTDGTAMADLELAADMGTFLSNEVQAFRLPVPGTCLPSGQIVSRYAATGHKCFCLLLPPMVSRNVSRRKKLLRDRPAPCCSAAQGSNQVISQLRQSSSVMAASSCASGHKPGLAADGASPDP